ncbi:MAG TPA: AAA family ATPase [Chloroflexota bacterium]|nr:AAA family ATPase [Chloroflexota bacterium]
MATSRPAIFGEILQRLRLAAGLTQEELAERARLSARAISDLERGAKTRPHLATVRQLSEALGLTDAERAELQRAARGQGPASPDNALRAASGVHTFLIADVRGYTQFTLDHGDEAAAGLATQFAHLVEETVGSWDGRVVELRGDEALAIFSSPRQALRAAVDIQARLAQYGETFPLGVGIGLDSGEAVPVGAGYRGTALNLAARLCSVADAGEVLASEGVIHLARKVDGLAYAEREPVALKGFGERVKVTSVGQSPAAPSSGPDMPALDVEQVLPVGGFLGSLPSGSLVARGDELGMLLHALEVVESGQGQLVLLAGEAGIGKTRLAQEATLVANGRGFLVAAGRCYEPQQSVPYYPFLDALGMAFAAAPAAVREQAFHRWPYLARLLPDQLGSTATPSSDSPEEQERLFRAISAFLLVLAGHRPVALLLDDLHWADSASLQLLQHLARQTRAGRVILLGTYRDVEVHPEHPLEATLRDLNREQLLNRIALKRLREEETFALITQTMGQVEEGSELVALVHRHTDGNPFFTGQVLQVLIENGSIIRQGGRWVQRAIQEIEVPESVRSVIAQRVARLHPGAQEVLQEASVLGPSFGIDDLLEMKSPDQNGDELEEAVDSTLAAAASIGLVRATGRDRYDFDHALTQQTLYSALSPRRRRRLHRAAGSAMENLPERVRRQRAAELAWHFLQGDNEAKAIQYSILAGDQAESVFAHAEAERHYRMALELTEETDDRRQRTESLEKLGAVLKIAGRYEEALELLERASRMHQEDRDRAGQGRVEAQIGLLCALTGAADKGIDRLQPLAGLLEPMGASRSLALVYAALVRLFDRAGRQGEQLEASGRLLDLARGLEDDRLLAEAELHQGVSLMHLGHYDEALQLLESAIPRAESVGDLPTVCTALGFSALAHHGRHEEAQARRNHERAVEVAERLGDPREISHRAVEAAYFTFLVGDWVRSREYAERAVASALELDNLRAFLQPLYTLGELSLYTGAWEDAAKYLAECVTIAEHLQLTDHLRDVQSLLSEKDLLEGHAEAALERLRPLTGTPGSQAHLTFLLSLAAARLEVGDLNAAEETIARAVADATRQRLPIGLVDATRIQGAIAARRGMWEDAERHLHRAIQLAHDISYRWGEARALYEYGLALSRQGQSTRAANQLRAAAAIFKTLGAEPYSARCDRASAAVGQ